MELSPAPQVALLCMADEPRDEITQVPSCLISLSRSGRSQPLLIVEKSGYHMDPGSSPFYSQGEGTGQLWIGRRGVGDVSLDEWSEYVQQVESKYALVVPRDRHDRREATVESGVQAVQHGSYALKSPGKHQRYSPILKWLLPLVGLARLINIRRVTLGWDGSTQFGVSWPSRGLGVSCLPDSPEGASGTLHILRSPCRDRIPLETTRS